MTNGIGTERVKFSLNNQPASNALKGNLTCYGADLSLPGIVCVLPWIHRREFDGTQQWNDGTIV